MRKFEKQYKAYLKRVEQPKTVGGVFYPNGFGEPCCYKRWVKFRQASQGAMQKFNKVMKEK